jgi:hypothetical protein
MLRPLLASLLARSGFTKPVNASLTETGTGGDASGGGESPRPDRERLPPRDDSFYLGICFSHW